MTDDRRARINRLKWHCRRALLELDLVFQRFWLKVDADDGSLDEKTESVLTRLLELEDHDLWALVSGKENSDDWELQMLVDRLRAV
jgi:antitoxin CptB